jgi:putative membrane protein
MVDKKIKANIDKAITDVEKTSSSELVAVITGKSGEYGIISIMTASITTLLLAVCILFFYNDISALDLVEIQVVFFVVLSTVLNVPYIQYLLVPKKLLRERASAKAKESFLILGLHETSNDQAVMLFVSKFEHYVEIVVDSGISKKLSNDIWQGIVDRFTADVKEDDFERGYERAIKAIGEILKKEFPKKDKVRNEIPNHLIEI